METHNLILGTHTSGGEPNYLMIYKVKVPSSDINEKEELKDSDNKVDVSIKINHEGEVNRARHMPQTSNIIATKTVKGEIHIFDYHKHPSKPTDSAVKPELRLTGHTEEGYGLCWSNLQKGYLISGSYDNKVSNNYLIIL